MNQTQHEPRCQLLHHPVDKGSCESNSRCCLSALITALLRLTALRKYVENHSLHTSGLKGQRQKEKQQFLKQIIILK